MRATYRFLLASILLISACGDDSTPTDSSTGDTSTGDTSTGDTSPPTDSSPGDSSPADTSPPVDTGMPPACAAPVIPALTTEEVAAGDSFNSPLFVDQAPGNTDTLWVVERGGRIRLVRGDTIIGNFLDVSDRITAGGEQGLLGLAFHPDYATNGRFFVYYTDDSGAERNVVAEYAVSGDPDVANDTEVRRLVEVDDRQGNHNGGMIAFGPDGFLYVGMGDEGGGCDTHGNPGNGQDTDVLFGKLLRLDVDNVAGGFAAAGNPFEGGGGLPQIWAYGLRNPWRFSFDRGTGDIYIGDVGQNAYEEIDFQPSSSTGGENYGWRFWEAFEMSGDTASGCDDTGAGGITHTEPVVAVTNDSSSEPIRGACSITGGYVYRGSAIPALAGVYLYGDYCSDDIAAFRYCDGAVMGHQRVDDLRRVGGGLSSFGEDNAGELYLVFLGSDEVHKIVPAP